MSDDELPASLRSVHGAPVSKPLDHQQARDLRWKVILYFRRLLNRREALPELVNTFIDNLFTVADQGRLFITDHEGDHKYGIPYINDEGQICYLPPSSSSTDQYAGFVAVSSRKDRPGNAPLAVAPGHRFARVADWFADEFIFKSFVSRAVLAFTQYLVDLRHSNIPVPRIGRDGGAWSFQQIEGALPIAVQYVIPHGDKPMLAFLDFDDLPDEDESIVAIRDKIYEELRPDVDILCLSRKKGSGRFGAHVWLTNVYVPVSEIKRIAELIPGTDTGVYAPGHLFRAWPHQKIGTGIYDEANPEALMKCRDYKLNENATSPRLRNDYDKIKQDCSKPHTGVRSFFCESCTFKQMAWIVKQIYAFHIPTKSILSFGEARIAQVTDIQMRCRDIPEPPTPFGVFHKLAPDHQSLRDIPFRIRHIINTFPRVFETWRSAVDTLDVMFTDIETVLGENVVRQPDGTVVCICQDHEGKVIKTMPKSSIENVISAQYCMSMCIKDKCANIAASLSKELNRSIGCGVSCSGKKENMTVKFDLGKILKGFLSVGRHLDFIPYNPLLLHLDHGENADNLVHANSYVSWDARDCQPYIYLAKKYVDLDEPEDIDDVLTLTQISDRIATSLKLMRRLFEDPKESDPMRMFMLWISFLQMRIMFPAMANKLVVPRPAPGNTVPPLCWYFSGDQGTGKSFWLITWMRMLFGAGYVDLIHRLTGRFDSVDQNALFGICDELPPDVPNGALINFLKRSTNTEQTVERKGVDAQQVKAYHNVILISNPFCKTSLSKVWEGITFDDRRTGAVRGSKKLTYTEVQGLPDLVDPRMAPVWRTVLTLGIGQPLKEAIVAKLPWAVFLIDQINDRVENASIPSNRYAIFSNWLSMNAPMTALKQDILKAAAKGPQRMVNLFANTGINMSAGMIWVDGHIRIDETVWDGKYWLRLCSFSSLLSLYRAIAQSSYADGRFTSGLTTADFASLLDEDRHLRLTWEEFQGLSPSERLDPEFSCTIDETHIYFPARDIARDNYENNTGMVLDSPYVAEIGIPRSPCYSIVGITYGIGQPLNYSYKEVAYRLEDVERCAGLNFPHLSFDAVIAAIIAFDLKPEYTMVPAVAQEIDDFRKARGDVSTAYQNAERIALARSASAASSQEFSATPPRQAKRATYDDEIEDEESGIVSTPDFGTDRPTHPQVKRSRR
jgi:hypothetical protein